MTQALPGSFSRIFENLIDRADVFGQLPTLKVLNKETQKSSVGFFMTLILMIITISYLKTEIISMLERSQPSMFASEELIFDTSAFKLNNDNFTLAISVADKHLNSIFGMGIYYNLSMEQCTRTRIEDPNSGNITIKLNCTEIPFETCNMSHFITDLQHSYFKKMKLGSLQCINRKFMQETPPILKGQLNSMEYKYLFITLKKCQNTTEYQKCASEEEILAKLQSAQYNIFSSEYLLQLARSNDPLEQIITPYYVSFSPTTSKKFLQYYQIIKSTTDDGLLFSSSRVQANLKKGQFESYSEIYNGDYLIQQSIAIQSVQTNYFRSYIKIQTILAKIGGIWQLMLLSCSLLLKWLLQNLMLLKVANQLFSFMGNKGQRGNYMSQFSDYPFIATVNFNSSFYESIKVLFGCNKSKRQQFISAKMEILKNLDIVEILKKLQRFEMFLKLIINETQYQTLMALSKPLIGQTQRGEKQKQSKFCLGNSLEQNEFLRQSDYIQISSLFRELKESKAQGLENDINIKLISEIEKQYFPNFNSEISSPKNQKLNDQIFELNDIISMEPKSQQVK